MKVFLKHPKNSMEANEIYPSVAWEREEPPMDLFGNLLSDGVAVKNVI
jgi:hypothetical protein